MGSSASQINPSQLSFYSVQNLQVPCEGPRSIPIVLDFSKNPSYQVNLQHTSALQYVSLVQGLYIDNSANTSALQILMVVSGQVISIGAGKQGYLGILCPNPPNIVFSSAGGVAINVHILNFPVTNQVWSAT